MAAGVIGGIALLAGGEDRQMVSGPRPGPSPSRSPDAPRATLRMRLGSVRAVPVTDRVKVRRLAGPAESVRAVLASLYRVGFVDAAHRGAARFPRFLEHFSPETRNEAERDLSHLTLGKTARALSGVRWARGRIELRFLTGARRQAVLAHADVSFRAMAVAGEEDVPISHRGRYVLRRTDAGWGIASYEARGSVPRPRALRRALRASMVPEVPSDDVLFILAIGSDARKRTPMHRALADSIHIVAINPRESTASILGIPRDSFVPIPGVGTRKINDSLFSGGPSLVVETVRRLTGVPIDAYLLTGFEGFRRMVGSIGGVEMEVPYPMSDRASGAYFRAGRTRLDGRKALAFARNRHDAPGGDFGRSLNQGRLILAALQEFRADLLRDPLTLLRWLAAGARYAETDLSLEELARLLMSAPSIERTENTVVAGTNGMVGGQSVVHLGGAAESIFRDLRRDGILGSGAR